VVPRVLVAASLATALRLPLLAAVAQDALASSPQPAPLPFEELAARCAPDIHPETLKGVVTTESSWNPYAIGVVGGRLERQPRSLEEAVAAARDLERKGFNFSMGLGQVNRYNLGRYGQTYESIFEPCANLKVGAAILEDCYVRAMKQLREEQQALRAAFSCYYSGNFTRGFRPEQAGGPSYVQKVVANAVDMARRAPVVPAVQAQASETALPARSPGRAPAASQESRSTPASPWVVFADGSSPGDDAPRKEASDADQPAARAQPPTPPPARTRPLPTQAAAQQVRRDTSADRPTESEAPFVQFVN
jgi:type IV secretion system protein VirB1